MGTLGTEDPSEVLSLVQQGTEARQLTASEILPGRACKGRLVLSNGVVHPSHVPWIAAALELRAEQIEAVLQGDAWLDSEGRYREENWSAVDTSPLTSVECTGTAALRRLLQNARGPGANALRAQGVEPSKLVLEQLPVELPASVAPFGVNPVRSPANAAWHALAWDSEYLVEFSDMPDIILAGRALDLQARFAELIHWLRFSTPAFRTVREHETVPPTPSDLLVMPPAPRVWWDDATRPLGLAFEGDVALLHFAHTVMQLDLVNGSFSVTPVGSVQLVNLLRGWGVFLTDGHPRLCIYDTARRAFVTDGSADLPARVVTSVGCGVDILDTTTRQRATIPFRPVGDGGFHVTVSGCGAFGWLGLAPDHDDLGVFETATLTSVYQPWPHPVLDTRPPADEYDETARAIGKVPSGGFRFVYGDSLCTEVGLTPLHSTRAAQFNADASRLLIIASETLTVLSIDARGAVTTGATWSLAPLFEHLCGGHLLDDSTGLAERELMGTVGTVDALQEMTPEDLEHALNDRGADEPSIEALTRLLAKAKKLALPTHLTRCSP